MAGKRENRLIAAAVVVAVTVVVAIAVTVAVAVVVALTVFVAVAVAVVSVLAVVILTPNDPASDATVFTFTACTTAADIFAIAAAVILCAAPRSSSSCPVAHSCTLLATP